MKVALTVNNYPPEFRGGTEQVVRALAHGLRAAGDRVLVISGSDRPHEGADVVVEDDEGIPVRRLPLRPGEGYGINVPRPRILALLRDLLAAERVDLVHVHHWSHLSDGQVRAVRSLDLGCVVTLHDAFTTCPRFFRVPPPGITCPAGTGREECVPCVAIDCPDPAERLRGQLEERDRNLQEELRLAHGLFAPSAACRDVLARHLSAELADRVRILPHGLLDPPAPAPSRPRREGPLRIGTFGNLNPEKGVFDLIDAMAGLPAELHLHGAAADGFRARAEERCAALGVQATWHGGYDPASHPATGLDLAVFASRCAETYGLVVDEALARGTPVLVSDRGALPERIARGGGLSVPAEDPVALRGAIRGLLEDREAYERLRRSIPSSFPSVAEAVAAYRRAYREAVSAARLPT